MKHRFFVAGGVAIFLIGLLACSSLPVRDQRFTAEISFSEAEGLLSSGASREAVLLAVGSPSQKLNLDREEVWIYDRSTPEGPQQRLSVGWLAGAPVVSSVTWLPPTGSPLLHKEGLLTYFKGAKFDSKDRGWIAGHEYSDEATLTDSARGISALVSKRTGLVWAISLAAAPITRLVSQ